MELDLYRKDPVGRTTPGELWITPNGGPRGFVSYTLEDLVRVGKKIKGETAIPGGRFRLSVVDSPKFGLCVNVEDVPGFTDIRMHAGNEHEHTRGCPLLGDELILQPDGDMAIKGGTSRDAVRRVFIRVKAALERGEEVWLNVHNADAIVNQLARVDDVV